MSETPQDAAAIVLVRNGKVCLARRNPKLSFLGGFHAFPGGKCDEDDAVVTVENCDDKELSKMMVTAVREIFEEAGILLVRGGEKLTKGQRASLHDDLISGRSKFSEILRDWDLSINAQDLVYSGFWTTPNISPKRFKTRFFFAECPAKQTPQCVISELDEIDFIEPRIAIERFMNGEILISPPVFYILREMAEQKDVKAAAIVLKRLSATLDGSILPIQMNSRVHCFPLKTETLPPATHTNCFIVGAREFIVIDAASHIAEEQEKLHKFVKTLLDKGGKCRAIIVSHLHNDHHGGESALKEFLRAETSQNVAILAHPLTIEKLAEKVSFDGEINGDFEFNLKDENNKPFLLKLLHTPGHARGHFCFYDEEFGFLLSSDNVLSFGSVVIYPPEGNMAQYLQTLQQMRDLKNLKFLCGSHGTAVFDAKGQIQRYIGHRLWREEKILDAYNAGFTDVDAIVAKSYRNLDERLLRLAKASAIAHLEKLRDEGKLPEV